MKQALYMLSGFVTYSVFVSGGSGRQSNADDDDGTFSRMDPPTIYISVNLVISIRNVNEGVGSFISYLLFYLPSSPPPSSMMIHSPTLGKCLG
jgi:hypothetical protein